ncbi:MAG: S8 family serine peptidase, partial [Isosphaeraceae bacterium]
ISGSVAGELLIQYRPEVNVQARALNRWNSGAQLGQEITSPVQSSSGEGMMELIKVPAGKSINELISFFKNQPGVDFAEPNYTISVSDISNDPSYTDGTLWNMYGSDSAQAGPAGTTNSFGSNAETAWNSGNTGSRSVVIGIVDTGIQITHPDLASNIWVNPNDPPDGIDNDGNGYVDDTNGWDFVNNDRTVYDGLSDSHGTHVAGIIGAQGGNGAGVAGVNWNVSMISAKFIGSQGGTTADAVRAIDYMTDLKIRNGVNIAAINASWGAGAYSSAIHSAINRAAKADILFVAAAGNNRTSNDQLPFYPASISTLNATSTESAATYDSVISVGALTSTGTLASFSNFGRNSVDLVAPGSIITSTIPNGYGINSGTSMAAPHVTGAIALYASRYPGTSASSIKNAIFSSVEPTAGLSDIVATGGRLDVGQALNIIPPPAAITSAISINDIAIVEGATGISYAEVTVALAQVNSGVVTVDYATANATALAGSDYLAVSGRLTFSPGIRSQVVRVPIKSDTLVEADETFFLRLSNPSTNSTISRNQGVVTILNDDNPSLTATITGSNSSIVEGNTGTKLAVFNLTRTGNTRSTSVISFVTSSRTALANQDFTPVSGTLVFMAGELSKQVRVPIIGDTNIEPDEFFSLLLSTTVNAKINTRELTCTIVDDDSSVAASSSVQTHLKDKLTPAITNDSKDLSQRKATKNQSTIIAPSPAIHPLRRPQAVAMAANGIKCGWISNPAKSSGRA